MNIRVDLNYPIRGGTEVKFRSPVDCSQVTGLIVYYPEDGITVSKEFAFADAHGNNVGDVDHLFTENVVVKVILDIATGMAFVQNADTNAYLEGRIDGVDLTLPQDLTDEQKAQARTNIGSVDPEYFAVIADEVGAATNDIWFIYDELNDTVSVNSQPFFEESQMAQARKNIGAATIDNYSIGRDAWSSKNTVDRLCTDIAGSGWAAVCEPVLADYPLSVVTQLPEDGCTGLTLRHFGENLLNVTATSKKENGVTFTVNSDGSIATTGTATADTFLELGKVQLINGTSYTLAGCPKDGGQTKHSIYYSSYVDAGDGATIKLTKTTNATFRIKIATGTNADGLVFRPVVYETNNSKTYSVKFGTTINGGSYDWNSGVLTDANGEETKLTAQTIAALDGVNTLWVDVGTNTVTGKADPVAVINKLTNAILALGGNI